MVHIQKNLWKTNKKSISPTRLASVSCSPPRQAAAARLPCVYHFKTYCLVSPGISHLLLSFCISGFLPFIASAGLIFGEGARQPMLHTVLAGIRTPFQYFAFVPSYLVALLNLEMNTQQSLSKRTQNKGYWWILVYFCLLQFIDDEL